MSHVTLKRNTAILFSKYLNAFPVSHQCMNSFGLNVFKKQFRPIPVVDTGHIQLTNGSTYLCVGERQRQIRGVEPVAGPWWRGEFAVTRERSCTKLLLFSVNVLGSTQVASRRMRWMRFATPIYVIEEPGTRQRCIKLRRRSFMRTTGRHAVSKLPGVVAT